MEDVTLQATLRHPGRHTVRELRNANRVPAVVYGPGIPPQTIAVDAKALHKTMSDSGKGLLTLQVGQQSPLRVLVREIQRDPIKHHPLHVDFQAVSLTESLRLNVPIVPEGTAPVMDNPNMILVRNMDTIEIECLPANIPNTIVADISKLETEDDVVLVKDLVLPPDVKLIADPDHLVISTSIARAQLAEEAEEAAELEQEAAEEVEVVSKGKKAEEETE